MAAEPTDAEADKADKRTPFARFEDLTRRLVAVPKAEVDMLRNGGRKIRRPARKR